MRPVESSFLFWWVPVSLQEGYPSQCHRDCNHSRHRREHLSCNYRNFCTTILLPAGHLKHSLLLNINRGRHRMLWRKPYFDGTANFLERQIVIIVTFSTHLMLSTIKLAYRTKVLWWKMKYKRYVFRVKCFYVTLCKWMKEKIWKFYSVKVSTQDTDHPHNLQKVVCLQERSMGEIPKRVGQFMTLPKRGTKWYVHE